MLPSGLRRRWTKDAQLAGSLGRGGGGSSAYLSRLLLPLLLLAALLASDAHAHLNAKASAHRKSEPSRRQQPLSSGLSPLSGEPMINGQLARQRALPAARPGESALANERPEETKVYSDAKCRKEACKQASDNIATDTRPLSSSLSHPSSRAPNGSPSHSIRQRPKVMERPKRWTHLTGHAPAAAATANSNNATTTNQTTSASAASRNSNNLVAATTNITHNDTRFLESRLMELKQKYMAKRAISDRAYHTLLIVYLIFIAFGALGNGLICLTILLKPKILSPRNIFIVNLAVSDLLLCVFTMPFSFIEISMNVWQFGSALCKLVASLQATSVFVSTISITAIALDRYRVIVYPTHQETANGTRGAALLLASVWIGALLLALPLFSVRSLESIKLPHLNKTTSTAQVTTVYRYEDYFESIDFCVEMWPFEHGRGIYSVVAMIFQYVLPITIVSIVYAKISDKLQKRLIRRQKTTQLECQQKRQLNLIKRTHTMLVSVSLIFGLSWLPLNLLNVIGDFYPEIFNRDDALFRLVFAICHLIGCSSACSNPILYGFLNENFRKEVRQVYEQRANNWQTCARHTWRRCLRLLIRVRDCGCLTKDSSASASTSSAAAAAAATAPTTTIVPAPNRTTTKRSSAATIDIGQPKASSNAARASSSVLLDCCSCCTIVVSDEDEGVDEDGDDDGGEDDDDDDDDEDEDDDDEDSDEDEQIESDTKGTVQESRKSLGAANLSTQRKQRKQEDRLRDANERRKRRASNERRQCDASDLSQLIGSDMNDVGGGSRTCRSYATGKSEQLNRRRTASSYAMAGSGSSSGQRRHRPLWRSAADLFGRPEHIGIGQLSEDDNVVVDGDCDGDDYVEDDGAAMRLIPLSGLRAHSAKQQRCSGHAMGGSLVAGGSGPNTWAITRSMRAATEHVASDRCRARKVRSCSSMGQANRVDDETNSPDPKRAVSPEAIECDSIGARNKAKNECKGANTSAADRLKPSTLRARTPTPTRAIGRPSSAITSNGLVRLCLCLGCDALPAAAPARVERGGVAAASDRRQRVRRRRKRRKRRRLAQERRASGGIAVAQVGDDLEDLDLKGPRRRWPRRTRRSGDRKRADCDCKCHNTRRVSIVAELAHELIRRLSEPNDRFACEPPPDRAENKRFNGCAIDATSGQLAASLDTEARPNLVPPTPPPKESFGRRVLLRCLAGSDFDVRDRSGAQESAEKVPQSAATVAKCAGEPNEAQVNYLSADNVATEASPSPAKHKGSSMGKPARSRRLSSASFVGRIWARKQRQTCTNCKHNPTTTTSEDESTSSASSSSSLHSCESPARKRKTGKADRKCSANAGTKLTPAKMVAQSSELRAQKSVLLSNASGGGGGGGSLLLSSRNSNDNNNNNSNNNGYESQAANVVLKVACYSDGRTQSDPVDNVPSATTTNTRKQIGAAASESPIAIGRYYLSIDTADRKSSTADETSFVDAREKSTSVVVLAAEEEEEANVGGDRMADVNVNVAGKRNSCVDVEETFDDLDDSVQVRARSMANGATDNKQQSGKRLSPASSSICTCSAHSLASNTTNLTTGPTTSATTTTNSSASTLSSTTSQNYIPTTNSLATATNPNTASNSQTTTTSTTTNTTASGSLSRASTVSTTFSNENGCGGDHSPGSHSIGRERTGSGTAASSASCCTRTAATASKRRRCSEIVAQVKSTRVCDAAANVEPGPKMSPIVVAHSLTDINSGGRHAHSLATTTTAAAADDDDDLGIMEGVADEQPINFRSSSVSQPNCNNSSGQVSNAAMTAGPTNTTTRLAAASYSAATPT